MLKKNIRGKIIKIHRLAYEYEKMYEKYIEMLNYYEFMCVLYVDGECTHDFILDLYVKTDSASHDLSDVEDVKVCLEGVV